MPWTRFMTKMAHLRATTTQQTILKVTSTRLAVTPVTWLFGCFYTRRNGDKLLLTVPYQSSTRWWCALVEKVNEKESRILLSSEQAERKPFASPWHRLLYDDWLIDWIPLIIKLMTPWSVMVNFSKVHQMIFLNNSKCMLLYKAGWMRKKKLFPTTTNDNSNLVVPFDNSCFCRRKH